ncbi:MAG: coproporphyrinogen dehydrogenase HemZ [Lachnospiraceae bacterium]|nr:coproporphyrinogen dehydrogenase HemZ [Lachnospiraceae bacterium]
MYSIKLSKAEYEYDVNSIFRAFYPGLLQGIVTENTGLAKRHELLKDLYLTIDVDDSDALFLFEDGDRFDFKFDEETMSFSGDHDKDFKNAFKRFMYNVFSEKTGKTLPWGNLTGIRPTKIALSLLNKGEGHESIRKFYKDMHMVSDEKIELSIDIAEREKALLSNIHCKDGYSLYIGIPFCPTTCLYCSFTSYPIGAMRDMVEDYLGALIKELEYVSEAFKGKILDTVYIGGGTPTTLTAWQLEKLLKKVRELFDFSTVLEFTVEAGRADSITEDKLRVLKEMGVTRISVNPQTFNQNTLDFIGRKATVKQVYEAYDLARKAGFDNINMDLILGLPGEGAEEVRFTAEEVKRLKPESLTVHSLAIKRASKLAQWIRENGISELNNTDETMEIAAKAAKDLGLKPYYLYRQKNMSGNFENVGYAAEGKFGLYNMLIMEEVQTIVACGAGTVTKRVDENGDISRCDNVKEVKLYIDEIDEMIQRKKELFS